MSIVFSVAFSSPRTPACLCSLCVRRTGQATCVRLGLGWQPVRAPRALPVVRFSDHYGVQIRPVHLVTDFELRGDQARAIDELVEGLNRGDRSQVLLGVTGSGKTFTMAQCVAR